MEFLHAPEIDRIGLIRRVTFDLTGLPPTPEEVRRFLADRGRMLTSDWSMSCSHGPRSAQRWAQHWLDLAHYADSNGFELDGERPDAWRYRDWVVNAINDDMPYDQFVIRQLAGDELEPGNNDALDRHRIRPLRALGRRGREHRPGRETASGIDRGDEHGRLRLPRSDDRLRPMPRPQVRPLADDRLLPPPVLFRRRDAGRCSDRQPRRRSDHYAAEEKRVNEQIAPIRPAEWRPSKHRTGQAMRKEKEANLTDAERAVRAIPEEKRTPEQKKLAEGSNKALNITWEEVAAAVAKNPEDHKKREAFKRAIHEMQLTLPRPPAKAMALIEEKKEVPETFVLSPRRPWESRSSRSRLGRRESCSSAGLKEHPASVVAYRVTDVAPSPRTGPLARARRQPADRPRDRQPSLAAPFRPRSGRDAERFRHARRNPYTSRTARLAGEPTRGRRLEVERPPPPDGHVRCLSARQCLPQRRSRERRSPEHASLAHEPPTSGSRVVARRPALRLRSVRTRNRAGRESSCRSSGKSKT